MPQLPKIEPFRRRLEELSDAMRAPEFFSDSRRAAEVGREHQHLSQLIEYYERLAELEGELKDNRQLLREKSTDEAMRELVEDDIVQLEEEEEALHEKILILMVPPEPTDSRNTVVEIRAGTGGEEASLFAADLMRMYQRYAEKMGWKVEPLSSSESESGGFKEVIALISGEDVYRYLKFESGVHRVQRVPRTETNGRIHTSTATVAVLPEAEDVDVEINPNDLEITVTRASGPGGQGVNTTDSAVQILHKPSGLRVFCADERSQLKNKVKGLKVLRARLLQKKQEEEHQRYAETRKGQIGTGDRSERIRTYNFSQSRLTDHRINLTLHSLPAVLEGELEELVEALQKADLDSKVEAFKSSEAAV